MKKYKLEKNSQNEAQYKLFTEQYLSYEAMKDKPAHITKWLEDNKYRNSVIWLDIEDAIIIEEVKPVSKRKKTVKVLKPRK